MKALFFFLALVKCVVSQTAMSPSEASVHLSSGVQGQSTGVILYRESSSKQLYCESPSTKSSLLSSEVQGQVHASLLLLFYEPTHLSKSIQGRSHIKFLVVRRSHIKVLVVRRTTKDLYVK